MTDWWLTGIATVLGAFTQAYLWRTHGPTLNWLDVVAGAVACLALLWRRSHPMAVFVLAFGVAGFAPLGLFAGQVAIATVATRVSRRALVAVLVIAAAASVVFPLVNPSAGEMLKIGFPAFLVTIIAFGWGLYLRARRELVASLRERASRLEADQQRAAEQAREAERRRIAREMHDVLAHRLSLLSVHAGALEYHPAATPGELARAAAVIRSSAAAALDDLRQVITLLREDEVRSVGPPPPGFGQIADLLEESRAVGMPVHAHLDLPEPGDLSDAVGRTVYRVVQEGLTNARKHAAGGPVRVTITATGQSVAAEVTSGRGMGSTETGAIPPGAGAGLIGLVERVTLAGGQLEHGLDASGAFVLRATLPASP